MIDTALIDQVFVACFPCDMRKSINGLSALVQLTFDMDPFANHLYVFFNRKGDKAKILRWSNNGWWLYYRKLSQVYIPTVKPHLHGQTVPSSRLN
jgi:transposase